MQIVALSATIPYGYDHLVVKQFGLTDNTLILREPTNRSELQYILLPDSSNFSSAKLEAQNILLRNLPRFTDSDRALLFVPFTTDGVELAKLLGCQFYQGGKKATDTQRLEAYNNWRTGVHKVMVCTSAFGTGNDYSHVRLVIHVGTPYEMIDYIQEASRAGRDKLPSQCYIITTTRRNKTSDILDIGGFGAIHTMLWNSSTCLRYHITQFIDKTGVYCKQSDSTKCSRCAIAQQSSRITLHPSHSITYNAIGSSPSLPLRQSLKSKQLSNSCSPLFKSQPTLHLRQSHHDTASKNPNQTSWLHSNSNYVSLSPISKSIPPPNQLALKTIPQKRQFNSTLFSEKAEGSRKRRMERHSLENDFVIFMKNALSIFSGKCAFCDVYGGKSSPKHSILFCSTWKDLENSGIHGTYREIKAKIIYKDQWHGSVCFKCHLPQCHDKLHPTFSKSLSCDYEDVLLPIGLAIYLKSPLCKLACEEFLQNWKSLDDFLCWLCSKPIHDKKTNLVALFCWFAITHYNVSV
jgi:hypothetical protein